MSADKEKAMPARGGLAWVVGVGPSRGLGAAVARRFAREGLPVALTGRSPEVLQTIVYEIEALGGQAMARPGDVSVEAEILDILRGLERMGPVEAAVYNAGNAIWGHPLDTKTEDFEAVWRVGCLGGFVFGREVARVMLQRGRGTLLFTGASAALRGKAAFAAFAAAKAGLRVVSQSCPYVESF
jgi:NAD(P)-dependent dehydrogenase (short-subunit alcohol dehydrogenase family)